MEYVELVMQALTAALSWFTDIITADDYLFEIYISLTFFSVVIALFVSPFLSSMHSGAGSDFASSKRGKAKETGDPGADKQSDYSGPSDRASD